MIFQSAGKQKRLPASASPESGSIIAGANYKIAEVATVKNRLMFDIDLAIHLRNQCFIW
jgi:hypothetical protein